MHVLRSINLCSRLARTAPFQSPPLDSLRALDHTLESLPALQPVVCQGGALVPLLSNLLHKFRQDSDVLRMALRWTLRLAQDSWVDFWLSCVPGLQYGFA